VYLLRVQILGFATLWPISGWALKGPMFRGLKDIGPDQLVMLEGIVSIFIAFLVGSTNLVLLHGRERISESDGNASIMPLIPYPWLRWGTPIIGILIGVLFVQNVVSDWSAIGGLGVFYSVLILVFAFGALFLWETIERSVVTESWIPRVPDSIAGSKPLRVLFLIAGFPYRLLALVVRGLSKLFQYMGPGYGRDGGVYIGHVIALLLFLYFLSFFYAQGLSGVLHQRGSLKSGWESSTSTLVLALYGIQFAVGFLCLLTFFFDRYRVPLVLFLILVVTSASYLNTSDHTFDATSVSEEKVDNLLSPKEVLARSSSRVIVVAAAGGGIQASGWTAQVLAKLTDEIPDFRKRITVVSGVSGGSVGALFYLASYPHEWSPEVSRQVREQATSSLLEDVGWGLVYPDLHGLLLPFNPWGKMDRGRALEQALKRNLGDISGTKMLDLASRVGKDLPVIILNATLTNKASPIVFTNSRFPDPAADSKHQRNIRSLWNDYRLDARIETAARISATFPYISPAARPEGLPGMDAFVDGGYFDNSGLYSLMAWLGQASEGPIDALPSGGAPRNPKREVLILMIDAFPEPSAQRDQLVNLQWYDQLLLPMTTVIGVRSSGQQARIEYEYPLFERSIANAIKVSAIRFRYTPSPRCALEPPPLSWRLTEQEKNCLDEGWSEPGVRKSRSLVREWLQAPPAI